jgi:hypothetical protein
MEALGRREHSDGFGLSHMVWRVGPTLTLGHREKEAESPMATGG